MKQLTGFAKAAVAEESYSVQECDATGDPQSIAAGYIILTSKTFADKQ